MSVQTTSRKRKTLPLDSSNGQSVFTFMPVVSGEQNTVSVCTSSMLRVTARQRGLRSSLLGNGDAIQAVTHQRDKEYVERQIRLMSCYHVNNYVCDASPSTTKITPHPAVIRISTTTSLIPIAIPEGFPAYYFNFCRYDDLASRVDRHEILTGKLQLSTTDATYFLRFTDEALQEDITHLSENKTTISLLLQDKPEENIGNIFTCEASSISYKPKRTWYYRSCPTCHRKVYETSQGWSYCITTTIADETGTTTATFFDEAVQMLLGKECKQVIKEGYDNENDIPKPLLEASGQPLLLQLQFQVTPSPGSSRFTITRAFALQKQQLLPETTTPPTTVIRKEVSVPEISSAKRQLFQTEGTFFFLL
ncbi:hypothetical protein L1987_42774 [Smallanthus sonchifolius]|uniref:Uncharacterized protein n=1 Tax=Smallanthus sonchifolius TaxID=185202 RepID=A0ACB9GKJ3_9ASTR|nr:hypothetical protein L1987_42774 [Smallanthus sonchifolius]